MTDVYGGEEFDDADDSGGDPIPGALSAAGSLATTPSGGGDYSGVLKQLNSATQRLKDQRSGLTMQQKISALLTGFAQPTAHTGWQSAVGGAAANLQKETDAQRIADAKRNDLISKYDLMAAHYGAQNQSAAARTAELAQAAKDRAAASAGKAAAGTVQITPPVFPGDVPRAYVKVLDPTTNQWTVKGVPIGTPGSQTVGGSPTAAASTAPTLGDPRNPYPTKVVKGSELMAKMGMTGLNPDSDYSFPTAGPEAGKPTEMKSADALSKYNIGNLTGPAVLAALPPSKAAEVQAILDGRVLAPTTGTRAKDGAELLQLATAADPTFDASKAKAKFATRNDYAPGGKSGQNFAAIDTVMNHIDKMAADASTLDNIGAPVLNAVKNAVSGATGNAAPNNYAQSSTAVANEMMKVFSGGRQGSTKDIEEWKKTLSPNLSPEQQDGAIKGALNLVVGRLGPKVDQWNQTMGENRSVLSFISPTARATFMKLDPSYQLTDDDKNFLMQQEVAKRQAKTTSAPKAAAAPGPSSATGGKAIPATTLAQYAAIPMENKSSARAYLRKQGYDISGLK